MDKHEQILLDNTKYVSYYVGTMIFFYFRQKILNQFDWNLREFLVRKITVCCFDDIISEEIKDEA